MRDTFSSFGGYFLHRQSKSGSPWSDARIFPEGAAQEALSSIRYYPVHSGSFFRSPEYFQLRFPVRRLRISPALLFVCALFRAGAGRSLSLKHSEINADTPPGGCPENCSSILFFGRRG